MHIARAFDLISAAPSAAPRVLCKPRTGPATIGGTEGGFSRFLNLRLFSRLFRVDTIPSPPGPLPPTRACRGNKENMDWFEDAVAGERPYPYELQLAVVRIGEITIGAVPGEATTNAGARMRRALASDSNADFASIYSRHLVLGLTNGYVHYIATPHEYGAQLYEGAATLYGPFTSEIIAQQLGRLARSLTHASSSQSNGQEMKPITIATRANRRLVPVARDRLPEITRRLQTRWAGDTLVARWTDHAPGNLNPADGALLQVERETDGRTEVVTWDDDPFLEVWHIRGRGREATWEARYAPHTLPRGSYRVILRARGRLPALTGEWLKH
jgi:hypothetical protein